MLRRVIGILLGILTVLTGILSASASARAESGLSVGTYAIPAPAALTSGQIVDGTGPPTSTTAAAHGYDPPAPSASERGTAQSHSVSMPQGMVRSSTPHVADRVAAEDAMAGVRAAGSAGERAAGIVKNTDHIPSLSDTAAYRIPDELNATTLGEVKNVGSLSYTQQLQDFQAYAAQQGLTFNLYVRGSTTLSGPLQTAVDDGLIEPVA